MEEYIIRSIEHSMRSMFLMVAVVRDSTGQCFILMIRDINDRKTLEIRRETKP